MTIIANTILLLVVLVALCFVVGYFKGRNQTYVVETPKTVKVVKKAPVKKTVVAKPTAKKVTKKTTKKTK